MKVQLIKPVKYDLSSCSSVYTPISSISKTEILSGKILPDTGYYRIVEFYRIPDTGIQIQHIPKCYTVHVGQVLISLFLAYNPNFLLNALFVVYCKCNLIYCT